MKEEKDAYKFTNASKKEENCKEIVAPETGAAEVVGTCEGSLTDSQSFPKLPYIALISKVILTSPLKKLNLASIYRAMDEQYPYQRSRGPGWKNSVRHSLSVNDCFVKVSRCENGRGPHWGVHQAHLGAPGTLPAGELRAVQASQREERQGG